MFESHVWHYLLFLHFIEIVSAIVDVSELPLSFETKYVIVLGCFVKMELLIIFMVNHTHEVLLFSVLALKPELSRSNLSLQIAAVKSAARQTRTPNRNIVVGTKLFCSWSL